MTNDTAVFEAMRFDPASVENERKRRLGTRDAIRRDGMEIDATSVAFCPHEGSIVLAMSTSISCASFR